MVSSEVSRGHSKLETSRNPTRRATAEVSQKDEGLNDKMKEQVKFIVGVKSRNI